MLTGNRVLDKQGERFLISVECDYCYKSENVEIDLSEINSDNQTLKDLSIFSSIEAAKELSIKGWDETNGKCIVCPECLGGA